MSILENKDYGCYSYEEYNKEEERLIKLMIRQLIKGLKLHWKKSRARYKEILALDIVKDKTRIIEEINDTLKIMDKWDNFIKNLFLKNINDNWGKIEELGDFVMEGYFAFFPVDNWEVLDFYIDNDWVTEEEAEEIGKYTYCYTHFEELYEFFSFFENGDYHYFIKELRKGKTTVEKLEASIKEW